MTHGLRTHNYCCCVARRSYNTCEGVTTMCRQQYRHFWLALLELSRNTHRFQQRWDQRVVVIFTHFRSLLANCLDFDSLVYLMVLHKSVSVPLTLSTSIVKSWVHISYSLTTVIEIALHTSFRRFDFSYQSLLYDSFVISFLNSFSVQVCKRVKQPSSTPSNIGLFFWNPVTSSSKSHFKQFYQTFECPNTFVFYSSLKYSLIETVF